MTRLPFAWMVALRFLREGRMQTALILSGVTAGVAVIIFLTALITGLQASIIARTLGTQAHVVVRPAEDTTRQVLDRDTVAVSARVDKRAQRLRSIDQWERILPLVERAPGVVAASPMVSGPAFAVRGNAAKSVALLGVDPDRYLRIVRMTDYVVAGHFRVTGTEGVIGIELAKDLGVGLGDKLRLVSPENRDDVITVAGIVDVGNKDLNRRWIFITLRLAQNLLDLAGGVSSIDATVERLFEAESVARVIESRTGLLSESWMQTNAQLLAALRNQSLTNRLIRGFVILIVALGIASVLVVSVVQKRSEIGILRAMGASRRGIMSVFLLQGALYGLLGSLLGSAGGVGLEAAFAGVFRNADGTALFKPEADVGMIATACLTALAIGIVAAAVPARRAARLDPVTAIRNG
ncbi:MAG: ABC transporter permease [Betaproteobacteria bacterium]|nr:ABC transporter permease [Betaproteobacteria bacterium]